MVSLQGRFEIRRPAKASCSADLRRESSYMVSGLELTRSPVRGCVSLGRRIRIPPCSGLNHGPPSCRSVMKTRMQPIGQRVSEAAARACAICRTN